MEKVKEFFKKPLGWAVLGIAVVVVLYVLSKRGSTSSAVSPVINENTGELIDPISGQVIQTQGPPGRPGQPGPASPPVFEGHPVPPSPVSTPVLPSSIQSVRFADGKVDSLQEWSSYFGTPLSRLYDLNPTLKNFKPGDILPAGTRVIVMQADTGFQNSPTPAPSSNGGSDLSTSPLFLGPPMPNPAVTAL